MTMGDIDLLRRNSLYRQEELAFEKSPLSYAKESKESQPTAKGVQDTMASATDLMEQIAEIWLWSWLNPFGLPPSVQESQAPSLDPVLSKPKGVSNPAAKGALEDLREFFRTWKDKVQDSSDEIHVEQILTAYLYQKLAMQEELIELNQLHLTERREKLKELNQEQLSIKGQIQAGHESTKKWSILQELTTACGLSAAGFSKDPLIGAITLSVSLGLVLNRYLDNQLEKQIAKLCSDDPAKQQQISSALQTAILFSSTAAYFGITGQNGISPLLSITQVTSQGMAWHSEEKTRKIEAMLKNLRFKREEEVQPKIQEALDSCKDGIAALFRSYEMIREQEKKNAAAKLRQIDRSIS
ncbi:MAG: hypothetical protein K0S07_294 [Chlamydiales bacterium]|nr:hypothetical protein [Chlamydiales bacterium]